MSEPALPQCARCGALLASSDALVCPQCGALVHADTLAQLAAEARWQAQYNPGKAIALWEQCLKLLPKNSRQYAAVQSEIDKLRSTAATHVAVEEPGALPVVRQESLPVAVLKTGLSMALSIAIYQFSFGWAGALGFVLLILIHELGHVAANLYYHLAASPPIFIPYLGAVINLRQNPPNARVEAIIGIAGPVAGTMASLVSFAIYWFTGSQLALVLSWIPDSP